MSKELDELVRQNKIRSIDIVSYVNSGQRSYVAELTLDEGSVKKISIYDPDSFVYNLDKEIERLFKSGEILGMHPIEIKYTRLTQPSKQEGLLRGQAPVHLDSGRTAAVRLHGLAAQGVQCHQHHQEDGQGPRHQAQ